jgi:hypothetical protein
MSNHRQLFFLFLGCYLLFYFVIDPKSYLVPFLLCGFGLFFYFHFNLAQTFFLLLIFSLPFENTLRQWTFKITPPLFTNNFLSGYELNAGLSIKLILSVSLFLVFLLNPPKKIHHHAKPTYFHPQILLYFFACATVISLFFHPLYSAFLPGIIRLWQTIAVFYFGYFFFRQPIIKKALIPLILSMIIFTVSLSLFQIVNQKPMGRWIEILPPLSEIGYFTTDGQKQYRASSYISHPVYYGSFLSLLTPIVLGLALKSASQLKNKTRTILLILLTILTTVSLLGTFSRSVWINILIIAFLTFDKKPTTMLSVLKQFLGRLPKKHLLLMLPFVIFLVIILVQSLIRSLSLAKIFSNYGNASVRIELIKQSLTMINNNPISGVGLNQFTSELVTQNIHSNLYSLIFPVHNTFFIFLTELGLPTGILFILFVLFLLTETYHIVKKHPLTFGIWVGCLTFVISAQFHPLFIYDPTLEMFMLLASYLSTVRNES